MSKLAAIALALPGVEQGIAAGAELVLAPGNLQGGTPLRVVH